MKICLPSSVAMILAFAAAAYAQQLDPAQPATQAPNPAQSQGSGGYQGQEHRGGRGGWGELGGDGIAGTVTAVAADHYMVRTETGDIFTAHFSANTHFLKEPPRGQGSGQGAPGSDNRPQQVKPTDIKVGDTIMVRGEVDGSAKSVGAMFILQVDPERAKQMREQEAMYGKTWIGGKVTVIDGVKVTLLGALDHAAHSFVADENTTFRKRRVPITLADIKVGDRVRADGAVKDGVFLATSVSVMDVQQGETPTVPRGAPPAAAQPPQ